MSLIELLCESIVQFPNGPQLDLNDNPSSINNDTETFLIHIYGKLKNIQIKTALNEPEYQSVFNLPIIYSTKTCYEKNNMIFDILKVEFPKSALVFVSRLLSLKDLSSLHYSKYLALLTKSLRINKLGIGIDIMFQLYKNLHNDNIKNYKKILFLLSRIENRPEFEFMITTLKAFYCSLFFHANQLKDEMLHVLKVFRRILKGEILPCSNQALEAMMPFFSLSESFWRLVCNDYYKNIHRINSKKSIKFFYKKLATSTALVSVKNDEFLDEVSDSSTEGNTLNQISLQENLEPISSGSETSFDDEQMNTIESTLSDYFKIKEKEKKDKRSLLNTDRALREKILSLFSEFSGSVDHIITIYSLYYKYDYDNEIHRKFVNLFSKLSQRECKTILSGQILFSTKKLLRIINFEYSKSQNAKILLPIIFLCRFFSKNTEIPSKLTKRLVFLCRKVWIDFWLLFKKKVDVNFFSFFKRYPFAAKYFICSFDYSIMRKFSQYEINSICQFVCNIRVVLNNHEKNTLKYILENFSKNHPSSKVVNTTIKKLNCNK